MFASRIPFSRLSRNESSPPLGEKPFYIIPDPFKPTRMANEGRIRVCASPVAKRQVRGDAENLPSFAMSRKSFKVVAPKAQ